jgi:hypothetical protein
MVDLPGWAWQVLAGAGGGLGLGVGIGIWRRRQQRAVARQAEPVTDDTPAATGRADTPQQRLLERLREQNLQLTGQLRANADLHAKQFVDKNQEHLAEKLRHQREVEELRQNHSAELSYLLKVVLEQTDALQQAHRRHSRALDAEIDRLKAVATQRLVGRHDLGGTDAANTSQLLDEAVTEVRAVEFAATQALESLRDR